MPPSSIFLSCFCIVSLLFNGCFAQLEQVGYPQAFQPFQPFQGLQQRQRLQRDQLNQCQLDRIDAQEPARRVESEAGYTDIWDENDEQFLCAGVVAVRHVIRPRGLLLPEYSSSPRLFYVVQGRGIHQGVFPGCPETYQSFEGGQSQQSRRSSEGQGQRQGDRDQHQKVRPIREGDLIALPQGSAQWIYNNGQNDLVIVLIIDTANPENQLDEHHRKFFLAGNPQQQLQSQRELECEEESGQCERSRERTRRLRRGAGSQTQEDRNGNVFSGFDERFIAEAFNVNQDLARRLKNENDYRGIIVFVQGELGLLSPEYSPEGREEEQEYLRRRSQRTERGRSRYGRYINGIEETFCTARLKFKINDPQRTDLFNPRAGRVTVCNSLKLPILALLQLSAEKGVLYSNAIKGPDWNMNAHSVIYFTRGNGRVQIVNDNGQPVFDGQVQEGQFLTAPQNFAIIKRAGNEGLEYISFKTNDYARTSQLAGRASALRSLPVEVVANAYQVSYEEARRIKNNREEVTLFSPGTRSQRY